MSITTFASLIAYPNTRKIALAEIVLTESINTTWTLYSGDVWMATIGAETLTLPGGNRYVYLEEITSLKIGSTSQIALTSNTPAGVLMTPYSYNMDTTVPVLLVNFGGLNPNTDTSMLPILMTFTMRFATEGISLSPTGLSDRYFDPFIKNIPIISQVNNQITGGFSSTNISNIELDNSEGVFDQLLPNYIWQNAPVTIRFGGESLPYSEYAVVFKGIISDIKWSVKSVILSLESVQALLSKTIIPAQIFDAGSYPNIDPAFSGAPIPIGYGDFTDSLTPGRGSVKAIGEDEVTNIGVDTIKMRFALNAVSTIDKVCISYDNAVSWTVATLDAAALPTSANKYSTISGVGGLSARFNLPQDVTSDGTNLFIADTFNHTIRKIVIATGVVTTLAGTAGVVGSADGTGSAARFWSPAGIANDGTNLYVCDTANHTIRKIVIATGVVTTLAGTAGASGLLDATGASAKFNYPKKLTYDSGNLYVSDYCNNTIRKIVIATAVVTTFTGSASGTSGSADGTGTAARFYRPFGITTDGTNLYTCDQFNHTIRKIVIATAVVTTLAGTAGVVGSADGTGSAARFLYPKGATTASGSLYITDSSNHTIRKIVIATGVVTTLAGYPGMSGYADGVVGSARFLYPDGLVSDGGNLYVADCFNYTIRKIIISSATVTTFAGGSGIAGSADGSGLAGSIWVRFTAAAYAPSTSKRPIVMVQFTGHYDGQGGRGYIGATGSEIIENILRSAPFSYTDSEINTPAFATAKANSNGNMSVYLDKAQSAQKVIDDICKGDAGIFFMDKSGLFTYSVWVPNRVTAASLDDTDVLDMDVAHRINDQFTVVRVGYARKNTGDYSYSYKQNSSSEAAAIYSINASKTITTYLTGSSSADVLSQRMLYLHKFPLAYVRGVCKWQLGSCNVGDKISISTQRAPYLLGSYADFIIELTSIQKNFSNGTITFEGRAVGGTGSNIGTWMGASAPDWASATESERAASGFWCDAAEYALTSDPTSLGVSRWW